MIQEQHRATEPQAHYSPEEAGEILRIAAHLQDNTITAEQLRAIAREAGVSDENLERAIQQYEQSRQELPAATPCPTRVNSLCSRVNSLRARVNSLRSRVNSLRARVNSPRL
jgi:transposase-like protein